MPNPVSITSNIHCPSPRLLGTHADVARASELDPHCRSDDQHLPQLPSSPEQRWTSAGFDVETKRDALCAQSGLKRRGQAPAQVRRSKSTGAIAMRPAHLGQIRDLVDQAEQMLPLAPIQRRHSASTWNNSKSRRINWGSPDGVSGCPISWLMLARTSDWPGWRPAAAARALPDEDLFLESLVDSLLLCAMPPLRDRSVVPV